MILVGLAFGSSENSIKDAESLNCKTADNVEAIFAANSNLPQNSQYRRAVSAQVTLTIHTPTLPMAPLISILIPAYNAEKWIAETLESALAQTWPNKEVIVVDDGSTDRTLLIARQFESPWVKVLSQPNQGASSARNVAFGLSQGDYIQWLDADDVLAPDKLAQQMEVAALVSKRTRL